MGDLYGASPAAGRLDAATAPERILDTAARLFYTRGLRAVGVNTIIAESGTAKATFYRHFPAKDDLILAYLDRADQVWTRQLHAAAAAAGPEPGHQLVGLFDALDSVSGHGSFRGCAFINAAAEAAPETPAHGRAIEHKRQVLEWITDLARRAGAHEPDRLARSLTLLLTAHWPAEHRRTAWPRQRGKRHGCSSGSASICTKVRIPGFHRGSAAMARIRSTTKPVKDRIAVAGCGRGGRNPCRFR